MKKTDCLPYAAPESLGIPSDALTRFIRYTQERNLNLHSIILLRHGKTALECYFKPYAPEKPHILWSLSKSFTSTAAGFAVQEGLLSLDTPIVDFFAEKLPCEPCGYMKKVTVRHLLSMASGHSVEPNAMNGTNWVYNFLTSYIDKEPGSIFTYNTAGTYVVSAILQKVTGQTVMDYLRPRLFEPLGFSEQTWWLSSPEGISCGGFGLNVTTRDLAKFGQFYLQRGSWEGKQLLNAEWIDLAVSKQIDNAGNTPDWRCGYGYQFWRCQPEGVYRGDGAFGQLCVVMPKQDAVLAVNAGTMPMQETLDGVWEILLPAMGEPLPENKAANETLNLLCENLQMPQPQLTDQMTVWEQVSRKRFALSDNPMGFTALSADFAPDGDHFRLESQNGEFAFTVRKDEFTPCRLPDDPENERVGNYCGREACGGWTASDIYEAYLYGEGYTTLDRLKITFLPVKNAVKVQFVRDSDMSPSDFTAFGIEE